MGCSPPPPHPSSPWFIRACISLEKIRSKKGEHGSLIKRNDRKSIGILWIVSKHEDMLGTLVSLSPSTLSN